MKTFLSVIAFALLAPAPTALPRDYPIRAVPLTAVTIDDGFWAPKLEVNRTVTIPHILKENDDTGRVANFEKAAGKKSGAYVGRRFNDTDVYKIIEVVGSSPTSIEDAIERAVTRASATVRDIRWFEVKETRGDVVDGRVSHYQVTLRIGFTLAA